MRDENEERNNHDWSGYDDDELARLSQLADQDGFLCEPLAEQDRRDVTTPAPLPIHTTIDGYRIIEQLAAGGKATVYKAVQTKVADREVALKVYYRRQDCNTHSSLAEIKTLAQLDHPNLAGIFDAGDLSDGRRYVVMPLIRGNELNEYCHLQRLSPVEIALLFSTVALAIHDVHQLGFVHCDVKSGNILVNNQGVPTITDFDAAQTAGTLADVILGTVGYLAPEQIVDNQGRIDGRTDIYGLGATLYEALCGRSVFAGGSTSGKLMSTLYDHPKAPHDVNPSVPRRLSMICMRCLEKTADKRYQTAEELAQALEAFVRDSSVGIRRKRSAPATVPGLMRILVIGVSGITLALLARHTYLRNETTPAPRIPDVPPHSANRITASATKQMLSSEASQRRSAYNRNLLRLGNMAGRDRDHVYRQLQDKAICPLELRGFAWNALAQLVEPSFAEWTADSSELYSMAIAKNGSWVATSSQNGIRVWQINPPALLAESSETPTPYSDLRIDADSRSVYSCHEFGVTRLDVDANESFLLARKSSAPATAVALLPDRTGYLVGDSSGIVEHWTSPDDRPTWTRKISKEAIVSLRAAGEDCCAVTGTGELFLVGLKSGDVREQQQVKHPYHAVARFCRASISKDLKAVGLSAMNNSIIVWSVPDQKSVAVLNDRKLLPDVEMVGSTKASGIRFLASGRNRVELWTGGRRDSILYRIGERAQNAEVASDRQAFTPMLVATDEAGRYLAIAQSDGRVLTSRLSKSFFKRWKPARQTVAGLTFSPNGDQLATYSGGGCLGVHSCKTGDMIWKNEPDAKVLAIEYSDGGRYIAVQRKGRRTDLLLAATGELLDTITAPDRTQAILNINDRLLVGIAGDRAVFLPIHEPSGGAKLTQASSGINGPLETACYDRESGLIAISHDTSMVTIGRMTDENRYDVLIERRIGDVRRIKLFPGGRYVAIGLRDGTIVICTARDLAEVVHRTPNASQVGGIAINSDGTEMVTGHFDGEVLFWDPISWEPKLSIRTDLQPIRGVEFSPDGKTLAVGGKGENLLVLRLEARMDN